jgi:alpha-L-rhamnosidase
MDWNAAWIWHPETANPDNFYMHARKVVALPRAPKEAALFVTASSLYKLYVNGHYVGRGPNPTDPSRYYYDVYDVTPHLRRGKNVLAALCYCYGPVNHGVLGQNWGRGGFILELRAPGEDGEPLLSTDGSWRVLQSPAWRQDMPLNCTLYGDFKEEDDSRREPEGWLDAGFDDSTWPEPEVLGRPPVEPWTALVRREIPFLGGERVHPVNVYWESASVTYSWRDDWEVYREWNLAPASTHVSKDGQDTRVYKTHDDFNPSLILDFGRDVTGYPEVTINESAGGVIDALYGEDLYMTRVDTWILKGGRQVLQPFNRRTFRYMKLLFRETPEPIQVGDVSMEMNTYPVEPRGAFLCSDPLLNRIYEVGRHTIRMSMLDHFVDCPWRERTLYGGDVHAENLIAHYAFGDPRLNAKSLRQLAHIQLKCGALPPYGPYSGCDGFYAAWSAYWGLSLLDHYAFTADREFLDELWPNLRRLLKWTIEQTGNPIGLIGRSNTPPKDIPGFEKMSPYQRWAYGTDKRYDAWDNFPFQLLMERSAETAATIGKARESADYRATAEKMAAALREQMFDRGTGLVKGSTHGQGHHSGQYHAGMALWAGLLPCGEGQRLCRRLFAPDVSPIASPFHGLYLAEGLYRYGHGRQALDFIREYWGGMLDRGATTFWEQEFRLDWPAGQVLSRGTSYSHGWSAGPTYLLPAYVLGVRVLEPGFRRALIEPDPADLAWAQGRVPTPLGPVCVSWTQGPGTFRMEIELPAGCTALVSLPPAVNERAQVLLDGREAAIERRFDRRLMEAPEGRHVVEVRLLR